MRISSVLASALLSCAALTGCGVDPTVIANSPGAGDAPGTEATTSTTSLAPPMNEAADCSATGPVAPEEAEVRCDEAQGWRMFAWIGVSGDGIVSLEQWDGATWVTRWYGALCPNGVAMGTPDQLAELGLPSALAEQWGHPRECCYPTMAA
ncbi:MAG TPA: hypothetical protein VGQ20_09755 [Acidimicrobiales bacterium]|jgi:hypothetical protein|nr:hypothetical protein [Acidimicrobiales bacterium]